MCPHVPGHLGLLQGRDGEDQQAGNGADLFSAGKLGGVQQADPVGVEVILSDEMEMIEKLFGGKEQGVEQYETANYSNATNSDAPDNEKFEIKTERVAGIITISADVMDEEDKESASYDDDAIKSDVCDEEILKMNIEAEGTENLTLDKGGFLTFATGNSGLQKCCRSMSQGFTEH